jgi:hypothetical protein
MVFGKTIELENLILICSLELHEKLSIQFQFPSFE